MLLLPPSQIGGIRFLYDNLVESVERFSSSSGFGCILAHSMGLGKTLQVISFIDVLFRRTQAHTVLAIVPVRTRGFDLGVVERGKGFNKCSDIWKKRKI